MTGHGCSLNLLTPEPLNMEESPKIPTSLLNKKTKKCIRDVTILSLLLLTLIGTVLGYLSVINGNKNVTGTDGCPSITLKTLSVRLCQDDAYLKFPPKSDVIQWKRNQLEDIGSILDYMANSDLISDDFVFYYMPDLVLSVNQTDHIGMSFRSIPVDIRDFYEVLKINKIV